MTKDEALALAGTLWWEDLTAAQVVRFQLQEPRLCMPFREFQRLTEVVLGRRVWTHEFAYPSLLLDELEGGSTPAPDGGADA